MDSKLEKLKKKAKGLGIEMDANETISDLEAKIAHHGMKGLLGKEDESKPPVRGEVLIPRRKPVKNINFTRRIDREVKENG
jgi:hypothetical protein